MIIEATIALQTLNLKQKCDNSLVSLNTKTHLALYC